MQRPFLLAALCLLLAGCADNSALHRWIAKDEQPIPDNAVFVGRSRWTGAPRFVDARRAPPTTAEK